MDTTLILAAGIPAIFLLIRIYKADRLEKEPIGLLLSLLILGVAATSLAAFAEELGDIVLSFFYPEGTLAYNIIMYFGVVAIAEEGFKYLLMKLRTWKSPHFNCQFDGVVYAVFISLGFALWENICYVLEYGFATAVARALTAVPGHACFGVFMGAWYGMAKRFEAAGLAVESPRARPRRFTTETGFWAAVLLHGTYDFIAVMQEESLSVVFIVFVLGMFIASLRLVKKHARQDDFIRQDPVDFDP